MRLCEVTKEVVIEARGLTKVYPSGGNFLLASFSKKGPAIKEIVDFMLSKHSIFIKDVSSKFSDGGKYVRFAVRLPDENERLVRCLSEL